MKLVYFSRSLNTKSSGVEKKIASQVFFLKQLQVEISIIIITDNEKAQTESRDIRFIVVPKFSKSKFRLINILTREHVIIRNLWYVICQLNTDDILYLRYRYPFFSWLYFMHKKRKCKIVFEHQSFEYQEYMKRGNYLYPLFDFMFGGSIRSHCDGIVGVTEEITKYQVKRSGDPGKPHVTLGNGIDVDAVPVKTSFSFSNSQLHLLCVANVMKWHGLDRLIRGMIEYKGPEKIYLHVVGEGEELPAIKKMVENSVITDTVFFYGPLHGKDLDNMFNRCDIAIGSLGIHRIGLHEATTLKAREYCARGIPFIYGIDDLDFPSDFSYILHIPADESSVDMAEVIRFAETVYSDLSFSIKMREYAKKSLDWSFKTMKLKQFLESLI
jgi:glycosyltransferase involved in cell wall biosynthesis